MSSPSESSQGDDNASRKSIVHHLRDLIDSIRKAMADEELQQDIDKHKYFKPTDKPMRISLMINEEKLAAEINDEQNPRPSESQLLNNTDSMNVMICGTSVETFWDKTPDGSIDLIDKKQHQFLQSDGIENKIETKDKSTIAVTA